MKRQPSGGAAVFRLPETVAERASAAGAGTRASLVSSQTGRRRNSHLLSYGDFREKNNEEFLTLFDGEGSSGGSALSAGSSADASHTASSTRRGKGVTSPGMPTGMQSTRHRASTASAGAAEDVSPVVIAASAASAMSVSPIDAVAASSPGLNVSAEAASQVAASAALFQRQQATTFRGRMQNNKRAGSPFPVMPGGAASAGGTGDATSTHLNPGSPGQSTHTNTRASSQNIKQILQQTKLPDNEPGLIESVRTSSDAQNYSSPGSSRNNYSGSRNNLASSSFSGSFNMLPRNSSSGDRLNGMYMNNLNGSNLALSSSLFARNNSGQDIFNLPRSNSSHNFLLPDPQAGGGISGGLSRSGGSNNSMNVGMGIGSSGSAPAGGSGMQKSSSLDQLANIVFMNEHQQQQEMSMPRPNSMNHLSQLASVARSGSSRVGPGASNISGPLQTGLGGQATGGTTHPRALAWTTAGNRPKFGWLAQEKGHDVVNEEGSKKLASSQSYIAAYSMQMQDWLEASNAQQALWHGQQLAIDQNLAGGRKRKGMMPSTKKPKRKKVAPRSTSKVSSLEQAASRIWQGCRVRTKEHGTSTVLSYRGNGALVIELGPDARASAMLKAQKKKLKNKSKNEGKEVGAEASASATTGGVDGGRVGGCSSTDLSDKQYQQTMRRTVQPSKVVFEEPFLNTLNLANDMQVVGGDPKRTSTSPAWRQLKHNSSIITMMGVAKLINCEPTTQSACARLPFGGIVYIPLRTLLSDMLRSNQTLTTAANFSNEHLRDPSVRQMAIKSAQSFLEKNIEQREKNLVANPSMAKKLASQAKKKKRKRATASAGSKTSLAASKTAFGRNASMPSSALSSSSAAELDPSLPIRSTKKARKARVRADKRELQCEVCNKKFRLQHNLRAHKRTHTGEQPFQCKFPGCGKRFNHGGNLLKHERRHIPYEQRPYPCDVPGCGKRFMESCDLRTHKKGHSMKRSSYRGVTIERGRWKAQIGYGGKTHHIGTFDTDVDAAKAYDSEALRVHGIKALLNFPKKGQAGQIGTRKAPPKVRGKSVRGRKGGLLAIASLDNVEK